VGGCNQPSGAQGKFEKVPPLNQLMASGLQRIGQKGGTTTTHKGERFKVSHDRTLPKLNTVNNPTNQTWITD
jgi:hypothetical protein